MSRGRTGGKAPYRPLVLWTWAAAVLALATYLPVPYPARYLALLLGVGAAGEVPAAPQAAGAAQDRFAIPPTDEGLWPDGVPPDPDQATHRVSL